MVICYVIVLAVLVVILAVSVTSESGSEGFEAEYSRRSGYDVKVVSGKDPCCNCSYFYDGKIDSFPYVEMKDRPHPPCCINRHRNMSDKSKCFVRDLL